MNLSDLVHRTAGDNNKVLTTATAETAATTNASRLPQSNTNNNLFQQSSPSTTHVFSNLTRQDPSSFIFSMPTMSQTDWMNDSLFFNSSTDSLIEPIPTNTTTTTATTTNTNSFLKQDMSFTTSFLNNSQRAATTSFQPPSIAPYPTTTTTPSSIFHRFDLTTTPNVILNHSTTTMNTTPTTANSPSPSPSIASLPTPVIKKPPEKKIHKVTITGDDVNADNIEDGYIQFVLNHDSNYISDGIESLMYAKRKFSSVPKTGDLSYTTWDIFELVLKLHKREIKNWSQLVGQLGLADMAGRPQFAQRVKRWMHRYKIDCYFDYLLGNKFYFNAPNEKSSSCLMMGNYKKRRPNNLLGEEQVSTIESQSDDENDGKTPILLAGSRKRMRDQSQNSLQMIENAKQYLNTNHSEEEEEEEEDGSDEEQAAMDTDDSEKEQDSEEEEKDIPVKLDLVEEEMEEEEVDEEEDELASTSSSPGSPVVISSILSLTKKTSSSPPPTLPCTHCAQHQHTISDLKNEMNQLKATLKSTIKQQSTMTAQMNKLLRLKNRTERWRKQLIEDLARGPLLLSDNDDDDDEEEEEEDETTDGGDA